MKVILTESACADLAVIGREIERAGRERAS